MEDANTYILKEIAGHLKKIAAGASLLDEKSSTAEYHKFLNNIADHIDEYKLRSSLSDLADGLRDAIGREGARERLQREAIIRQRHDVAADKAFWKRRAATTLAIGDVTP